MHHYQKSPNFKAIHIQSTSSSALTALMYNIRSAKLLPEGVDFVHEQLGTDVFINTQRNSLEEKGILENLRNINLLEPDSVDTTGITVESISRREMIDLLAKPPEVEHPIEVIPPEVEPPIEVKPPEPEIIRPPWIKGILPRR